MKKIAILILSTLLTGCGVDHMVKANTSISAFDGMQTVSTKPIFVYAPTGKHGTSFLVGASWNKTLGENVAVKAVVNYEYVGITNLEMSFNGDTRKYSAVNITEFNTPNHQTVSSRSSSQVFLVPITDIQKIENTQNVKIRIITRKGELTGDVVKQGDLSPGAKALINVVKEIPK